jgi:hypothetical protein
MVCLFEVPYFLDKCLNVYVKGKLINEFLHEQMNEGTSKGLNEPTST